MKDARKRFKNMLPPFRCMSREANACCLPSIHRRFMLRCPVSNSEGVVRLCDLQQMIEQGIVQEPLDLAVKLLCVIETLHHDCQVIMALAIAPGASLAE